MLLGVVCLSCGALATTRNLAQTVASASEVEVEAAGPAGTSSLVFLSALTHGSVCATHLHSCTYVMHDIVSVVGICFFCVCMHKSIRQPLGIPEQDWLVMVIAQKKRQ
jgi:protein-S-isoprenylcysteine O-methyltransferase Ste14